MKYLFLPVILTALVLNSAYPESLIWAWYARPRGLPPISMAEFVAINLAVSLFFSRTSPAKPQPLDCRTPAQIGQAWLVYALWPWTALAVAWFFRP